MKYTVVTQIAVKDGKLLTKWRKRMITRKIINGVK